MDEKKAAVFDIDGTLFRSSLLIELVEAMIVEGVIPASAREAYALQELCWLDRKQTYHQYIDAVVKTFMGHIQGVHYADFDRVARVVGATHKNRVYRFTRDLITKLKDEGYFLLAISQSPKRILDIFCSEYGFDKVYGRVYELGPSDRFTGVVIDEHLIGNKSTILKRAVEKNNLTLEESIGVGDTEGDISFLELVENPICFNPNALLYRHAKINNWRVVVERKDVVYELGQENIPQ